MSLMTEATYRQNQEQLKSMKLFRLFWQFWSNYAFVFFGLMFLVLAYQWNSNVLIRPVLVLAIISFVLCRGVIVSMINFFYKKPRPYQLYKFQPITSKFFSFKTELPNSFPSRHMAAYFSLASVFCIFYPVEGSALIGISLLAGFGRVILGFHWPEDIVAGAILGLLVGYLTVWVGYPLLYSIHLF